MTGLRSGVVLQGVDAPGDFVELVRQIDGLGYDILWLTDSSLHSRNCWSYLTLAALTSDRLRLGTAVTNPVTRHPAITAAAFATVDEISGGRAVFGIGAGDRPLIALGLEPAKVGGLRAAIDVSRRLWAGETVDADAAGAQFQAAHLRFAARPDPPVFVSASGPKTLELAGEVADGVILLCGLFPAGLAYALEHVDRGARKAGRPRPHIALFCYGRIDDDEEAAVAAARSIAAWFPQTAPRYCELAGLDPAIAARVRAEYRGGEFQEGGGAAALLPDEFVRAMALAGSPERITGQLDALAALGVDSFHLFPLGDDRPTTIERFARVLERMNAPS